jgi:hypothetical protein
MTLVFWYMGKPLLWDFTCRDTYAASYLTETSRCLGAAAEIGELSKKRQYKDLEWDYIFVPACGYRDFRIVGKGSIIIHQNNWQEDFPIN